jgi:hypothetical protein
VKKRFVATAILAMVVMAAFATTAQAFPTKTSACSGCHTKSTTVHVTAVQTANNGVTATYQVTVTGPNAILGWTVLSGTTNVKNATAGTGTFSVPVGKTYTVWGVSKTSAAMPYSNSITISPVAPVVVVPPTPVPTTTPNPTTTPEPTATPEPTTTPVPVYTVGMRMHFEHPKGAVVKLIDVVTGKVFYGHITRSHNRITFSNVPAGTYTLTTKYKGHKTKNWGQFIVANGTIHKVVPVEIDD